MNNIISNNLGRILSDEFAWICAAILLASAIFRLITGRNLDPQKRIGENIFEGIWILVSLVYTTNALVNWIHFDRQQLTSYEHCLILTAIVLVASGAFSFLIFAIYRRDSLSFVEKGDVIDIQKKIDRIEIVRHKEAVVQRIAMIDKIKAGDEITTKVEMITRENNESIFIRLIERDGRTPKDSRICRAHLSGTISLLILDEVLYGEDRHEFHSLYLESDRQENLIYLSSEGSSSFLTNKKIDAMIPDIRRNVINTEQIGPLILALSDFYKERLKELDRLTQVGSQFTLGAIWYYTIMVVLGSKVDYIIPVSPIAKGTILILSVYRLLILGSLLTIFLKSKFLEGGAIVN